MAEHMDERNLVSLLGDARAHSEAQVISRLGIKRSELGRLLVELEGKGLEILREEDHKLRLAHPLELLQEECIRAGLEAEINARVPEIEILWSTHSTNLDLAEKPATETGQSRVCLAEYQTAGKGRLGREWIAPLASALCLSVSYRLSNTNKHMAAAALVAGIAVRNALQNCGVQGVGLKWPNDLVWDGRKLGGLLLESRSEHIGGKRDAVNIIVGIGINYRLSPGQLKQIVKLGGLVPVDLIEIARPQLPGRNRLVAAVLSELLPALASFTEEGFAPFVEAWSAADACKDTEVTVTTPSQELCGVARGIDAAGALRLDVDGKITSVVSAQIQMRPA